MDTAFEMNRVIEKAEECEKVQRYTEKAKKYCAEKRNTLIPHMKCGDKGDKIISLAEQEKSDLIVIGSHGKGSIDHLPEWECQCICGYPCQSYDNGGQILTFL